MFHMRFDMRAPANGAPAKDLYQAALEICAWAESRGALIVTICEHHASPDGYLPSPLILASAVAARTTTLPITVSIFNLPLYNPVRLAEEMCVLDILSNGRIRYTGGIGYRPAEYEMHGVDFHRRGKIADEYLELLLKAVTGEPFEHQGRHIHVTPPPLTPGGPRIAWGGGSPAAARRAGRLGLDLFAHQGGPEVTVAYEEACRAAGHPLGACHVPARDGAAIVFVADDLDAAWAELGPYLMNDATSYAAWHEGMAETSGYISFAKTAQELRAENRSHRIITVDEAVAWVKGGQPLPLHPIIGGTPPEMAWRYLRTMAEKVLPAVA
jgi:alkanesulfonate monooxygenase SsuD/methylene tetrahydromethanopterin reductase-like flavin-dependent oxidoreductase (luciferase family)